MIGVQMSQLINLNAIKYVRLDELAKGNFGRLKRPTKINVIIDLNRILRRIYINHDNTIDYLEITSDLINLCGHYSNYFYSYCPIVNTHLVMGSFVPPYNTRIISKYNSRKVSKMITNSFTQRVIDKSLDMISTISKYIQGFYFNRTEYEAGVIMKEIIELGGDDSLNIIITSDSYNYQLADRDNVLIFVPNKKSVNDKREDLSYVVSKYNKIKTYCIEKKYKFDSKLLNELDDNLYSLFLTVNGCPMRDLNKKIRVNESLKLIKKNVDEFNIINGHNTSLMNFRGSNLGDIEDLYKVIDIPIQYNHYKSSTDYINLQFIDLKDEENLNRMNNVYFEKNPIILSNF